MEVATRQDSLEAGRWIVGVSKNTSHERVAKELGWQSIETEKDIAKLCYQARIMKMEKHRWPNIALTDMQRRGSQYGYIKEIQGIKLRYDIPQDILRVQNHGFNIRRHIRQHQITQATNSNTQECQHQGPTPGYMKSRYLGTYPSKLWLRRARTHDWWNILGNFQRRTCPVCSTPTGCIINHIIQSEGQCGKDKPPQNGMECDSIWNGDEEDQRKINE